MTAIYDRAAKALAALDFTEENELIAAHAAEGERLSAAMRKAETRINEVQAQISKILQDKLAERETAVAVADALLGEADAREATASLVRERDLRDELNALRAGLRELQDRSRDQGDVMAHAKGEAMRKVVPALEPVVQSLIADARAAAQQIGQAFASIAAIAGATRYFHYEARQFGDALARLMSADLVARKDLIDTPDSILEMFAPLADKGPAAAVRVPTYAGVPDDRSNLSILGGMMGRMADMQATR